MEPNIVVEGDKIVIREHDHVREIPLFALASYSELLGYADPFDTLDAILHIQDHGEPEPDPVTGENVWAEPYTLLTHREHQRLEGYKQAIKEGTANDPRSPALRAALAARDAVHTPVNGGDCVMDRCRANVRRRLGVKEPQHNAGAATRGLTQRSTSLAAVGASKQSAVARVIGPHLEKLPVYRNQFLAMLTPEEDDPFTPEPEPEPDPLGRLFDKYGEG